MELARTAVRVLMEQKMLQSKQASLEDAHAKPSGNYQTQTRTPPRGWMVGCRPKCAAASTSFLCLLWGAMVLWGKLQCYVGRARQGTTGRLRGRRSEASYGKARPAVGWWARVLERVHACDRLQ